MVAALLALAAACGSFGASDEPLGGADAAGAEGGDSAGDAASSDAGPPSISSEGFEIDRGACGIWQGTEALTARVADAGPNARYAAAFISNGSFNFGSETKAPSWTHVSHAISPDAGGALTAAIAGNKADADAGKPCFLVDDISVRRVD